MKLMKLNIQGPSPQRAPRNLVHVVLNIVVICRATTPLKTNNSYPYLGGGCEGASITVQASDPKNVGPPLLGEGR